MLGQILPARMAPDRYVGLQPPVRGVAASSTWGCSVPLAARQRQPLQVALGIPGHGTHALQVVLVRVRVRVRVRVGVGVRVKNRGRGRGRVGLGLGLG